jgi:hypothetical protein
MPAPTDDKEVRAVLEVDIPKKSPREPNAEGHLPSTEDDGNPIEDYDVEELEEELTKRRKRVRDVCEATGLDRDVEPNAWEFFIDHRHHLIWCNIFKAASSTWMYNFNLLGECRFPFRLLNIKVNALLRMPN